MYQEHEQTLNVWLAGHLKKYGLDAKPESRKTGNRRIDVEIRIRPLVIALEAEHGQGPGKKASAIQDADARLKQGLAQCAIAVCYPEFTTEESLSTAQLLWTVRDPAAPTPAAAEWSEGTIDQLVSVIRLAPAQLGDPDSVAAALSSSLDGAVNRLSETQKRELARKLDLPERANIARGDPLDTAAKRALLVIVTAVMFHARLDNHRHKLRPDMDNRTSPPKKFDDDWPPPMAQECANAADPIQAFADAWNLILALDYKPIFETGRVALFACPNDYAFTAAVLDSARAALAVVRTIAGLRHDLLGRIFHTVLDTARYDGSFYTTTPAATLLATLAIDEDMCDWTDTEAIANLRIIDPACGTGTLLMAAAERIRDLAPHTLDDETVAAALIEKVLSGYDINLTATHMAATTLGLLSPTTQFRNMKIGRTFLGVDEGGKAHLGSLEFLDRQALLIPWPSSAQAASQVETGEEMPQAEAADLVIMNPPFTRDSLRHDQFTHEEERKIKAREKALFAREPVDLSGNSGPFMILGDHIAKADRGAIAAILPLVASTNASWLETRQYLASRYHIETIITSHDPERIYFSENTDIGETLLICRQWPETERPKPATIVANLAANPASPSAAIAVTYAIKKGTLEEQRIGTVQLWPQSRIAAGDWGAVQFLSPYLCEIFVSLKGSEFFPSIALGRIADIGPEGRRVREAFKKSAMPSAAGRVALWRHDTEKTQSMAASWDTHISAKATKAHLASKYWEQRSTFLLPHRFRLNTVKSVAVRLEAPVVGSAWTQCRLAERGTGVKTLEKAYCVFLNSSFGILALLGNRTNKVPSYPQFSLDDLRKLRVPDFSAIGPDAVSVLDAAYVAHAHDILLPLPQMNQCPVRHALDQAVTKALDLNWELVPNIRRTLTEEPSVTGQRYAYLPHA